VADVKNVVDTLNGLTPFQGRRPDTSDAEMSSAFATLFDYRDGAIFTGSYSGDSSWERHTNGDEIVYVLDGATRIILLEQSGEEAVDLIKGSMIVVPQSIWHRFESPDGVTVLSVTPQPTDHSQADDPRDAG
jgi:mannose-6-phosphate isomerase-like protein (cupin superfamily)